MKVSNQIQLTAVLIRDDESQGFTAFFEGMPEATAEGDTEQEALDNLVETFNLVMEYKRDEHSQQYANTISSHTSHSVQLSGMLARGSFLEPA
ncbi:MAG: type II toxin-antitoxin system HicB family antitoxin [Janthinobacterium lividum]